MRDIFKKPGNKGIGFGPRPPSPGGFEKRTMRLGPYTVLNCRFDVVTGRKARGLGQDRHESHVAPRSPANPDPRPFIARFSEFGRPIRCN